MARITTTRRAFLETIAGAVPPRPARWRRSNRRGATPPTIHSPSAAWAPAGGARP